MHPNNVVIFRVENRVIRARFSTLPAWNLLQWCTEPEKSSKLDRESFKSYRRETIGITLKTVWVCFGCKTESFGRSLQLCLLWGCIGCLRAKKSFQNSTETFFSLTDEKQ